MICNEIIQFYVYHESVFLKIMISIDDRSCVEIIK